MIGNFPDRHPELSEGCRPKKYFYRLMLKKLCADRSGASLGAEARRALIKLMQLK